MLAPVDSAVGHDVQFTHPDKCKPLSLLWMLVVLYTRQGGGKVCLSLIAREGKTRNSFMSEKHRNKPSPLSTRREMLSLSGKVALAGIAADTVSQGETKRPRLACVVTYWAAPSSHADWIIA